MDVLHQIRTVQEDDGNTDCGASVSVLLICLQMGVDQTYCVKLKKKKAWEVLAELDLT